jgi:DNA modification methylase
LSKVTIYQGDALAVLRSLPAGSVHCAVTSPPYWGLRDYGAAGQLGLERIPEEYIKRLVEIFREVRRVLRDDGILWLNLGYCYATGAGKVGECPRHRSRSFWRGRHDRDGVRAATSGRHPDRTQSAVLQYGRAADQA